MLPLITSQAIALAHAKKAADKNRATEPATQAKRRSLVSRVFDAIAASRFRRAELELALHRRMRGEIDKQ